MSILLKWLYLYSINRWIYNWTLSSIWWWKERFWWRELLIKQRDMRTWCSSFKRLLRMQVKMSPRKLKIYPVLDERIWLQSNAKKHLLYQFLSFPFWNVTKAKATKEHKKCPDYSANCAEYKEKISKELGFHTHNLYFILFIKNILFISWLQQD